MYLVQYWTGAHGQQVFTSLEEAYNAVQAHAREILSNPNVRIEFVSKGPHRWVPVNPVYSLQTMRGLVAYDIQYIPAPNSPLVLI